MQQYTLLAAAAAAATAFALYRTLIRNRKAAESANVQQQQQQDSTTYGHLRAVIIGVGGISKQHATSLRELGIELVGCCCRTAEKGKAFAAEHGGTWYSSYTELLEEHAESVDFAIITTPSGAHLAPALACFEKGIHVLCEKPLEITVERADAMIAAADRAGLLLGGIFQSRFTPALQALHGAIGKGALGEQLAVLSAQVPWWRDDEYYAPSRWQGTLALDGGGAFINQAIHALDQMQWLARARNDANDVQEVFARMGNRSHTETPSMEVRVLDEHADDDGGRSSHLQPHRCAPRSCLVVSSPCAVHPIDTP
jgi:predicted dehydrogenase